MNWLENALSPALVRALGWTIVHSLWQGAVVGLALVGLLLVLRRHSAQVRYNVACVALATMLGLALATFVRHYAIALNTTDAVAMSTAPVNAAVTTVVSTDFLQHSAAPAEAVAAAGVPAWLAYFDHNLPLIVAAWLLGLLAMTLRLLGGLAYVQRLRHYRVQPLAAHWSERLAVLAAKAGLKKSITLLESALVKAPLVAGHLKPVILLPLGTVLGLAPAQLEAILAHELAHIARRDYLMNILQSVAEILFFYHPAAWFITACLRTERENCCDDEATAICGDPLTLARALAALAEMGHDVMPVPQLALSAVGPDGSLLGRIRRLVQRRAAPTFSEGVMAALVVMGGLVLLGLTAAVSMASPRPWADKAKALAGLVAGPDNAAWLHSLTAMHQDTLPPLPALDPALDSALCLTQDDDGDKDKKKSKRKTKDGDRHVVIMRNEQVQRPDWRDDGQTVIVKRDKKGRATEIVVDGRRIDLQAENKKVKGGSTEIIRLPEPGRADRRWSSRGDDFAFNFKEGSETYGMTFKDKEALRMAFPGFRMNLNLDTERVRANAQRAAGKTSVTRDGKRVEIRNGKHVQIIDTDKLQEEALRDAEHDLRDAIRDETNEKVREQLDEQLDRLQEQREELRNQQLERRLEREQEQRDRAQELRDRQQEQRDRAQEQRDRAQEQRDRQQEQREQTEAAMVRELRADGLIADPDNYQFSLSAKSMVVNGKTQSAAKRDKYLSLLQDQSGRKLAPGSSYIVTRNTDSSTSTISGPRPPRPPRAPRVTPATPPTPPTPPMAPAAPRKPALDSNEIGAQLRRDGLIGKDDQSYQLQLNQASMSVNGQKQPDEVAKKYRELLNHTNDKSFNINISVSE
ncbi:BlaR1 peptidase M56 [Hymenobacter daecheongensis DSM 21074]|uniref:BlaR1 peptidase M56 n=1 Tax=Hymenobacter daecheongensis DSM 21074 TaxID=1121955 RepID=A0A1M6CGZ3_9BACT|nr:M56 family metallopeptidase [Hymenobacter daecheongensis]SHI60282.1 BlaR1 peptidase M56 [Hymenobacter daecheongensis DSM 21074]